MDATGLQLSRRDVLVTSFGIDPRTRKLMLRLWEQAGRDGPCTIALPQGLAVSAAQPCDLRNRPLGEPIAVDGGRLQVDIGHNAPVNLELMRSPAAAAELRHAQEPGIVGSESGAR